MAQYNHFKSLYPDAILLFKLGDFYELFNQDAIESSKILNITLTTKRIGENKSMGIPMCGFPTHSSDIHIEKLIKVGKTIAICDQVEDAREAKKNGRVIKREVVRVITPGTIFEERFLKSSQNNYLCNFLPVNYHQKDFSNQVLYNNTSRFSISWLDLSTGYFYTTETTYDNLLSELTRISPNEILLPKSLIENPSISKLIKSFNISTESDEIFKIKNTLSKFNETYNLNLNYNQLINSNGFFDGTSERNFSIDELNSSGSILNYVINTQMGNIPHLYPLKKFSSSNTMSIDFSTMQSLEIIKTLQNQKKGTILDCLDKTLTSSGSRLLYSRIQSPSLNINEINNRLNLIEFFYENLDITKEIRKLLVRCLDLERCLQRVYISKAGPRDLSGIGSTLAISMEIKRILDERIKKLKPTPQINNLVENINNKLNDFKQLLLYLSSALVDNPPFNTSDGNFIEKGYSKELDNTIKARDNSKELVQEIQKKYRDQLSLPSLKIKHNQIIGYYFEIQSTFKNKIPSNFIHVQTLLSHMRFKSEDLLKLEDEINISVSKALEIEIGLFNQLCKLTLSFGDQIKETSDVLSIIDVSTTLALIAKERLYVKPIINETKSLKVINGRHPTVELVTKNFISNDLVLNDDSNNHEKEDETLLWLITGPNMGGKSTFLRQNAIIILMAQMGSYVPADYAEIGIVDQIFSRVGSSDDLSNDRSTFMVEMVETAQILKKATDKSFVIMDEVGRGTSTLDGISIAQSVIEHLVSDNKSRTLFATHYHELTKKLNQEQDQFISKKIKNYCCIIKEHQGEILFAHKIIPGIANKSYGIYCAKLANLPEKVLNRANSILTNLENNNKLF
ncbi:hypothetical protein DICPUDRAFT_29143 [Dictyostelium purpureum]|uniref:DNA mismatch repair proteins mutS family domain-containing protein n=1 Tax=Dictyostelium purpureum TaxID=5786 RepID=F0ZD22_DICPU|nr:uncharacterized protein DICPUDRAFT_29143 [Dictyostelium purpureum]EGC38193.1 hypothetical protein DICPUDRAFT_29143 [Dictyostelium purpureum]|eukprot:XP_003285320.1 hypothetical protein DICPUDRAFT_29143 [Dictyostelium purpureum]